jgi:ribonuclease HII
VAVTPTAVVEPDGSSAGRCVPTLDEERRLWSCGHRWVAGLDEVGRGAWAGPLTVGIAVLTPQADDRPMPSFLRDSKLLAEARREALFDEVVAWCDAWSVGHASPVECDRYGMTAALRLAAIRALGSLRRRMDAMLIDGPRDLLLGRKAAQDDGPDPCDSPRRPAWRTVEADFEATVAAVRRRRPPSVVVPVVDGDATCAAVSAASVLAKVVRDRLMRNDAEHYPPFDFDRNKGYPSPTHRAALQGYGLTSIHRRSWAFTDELIWR